MSNTIKFTKKIIESLDIPKTRTRYLSDEVKGLCLEVTKYGVKSFRLRYKINTNSQTFTIGKFPDIGTHQVITKAKELKALITQGIDPQSNKIDKRKEDTFKIFFIDKYLPIQASRKGFPKVKVIWARNKANTKDVLKWDSKVPKKLDNVLESFNAYFLKAKFFNLKLSEITDVHITSFIKGVSSNAYANRMVRELRAVFNTTDLSINPVAKALKRELTLRVVNPRTIKASKEQLIEIGKSLHKVKYGFLADSGHYYQPRPLQASIIEILLYEGLRPSEVMSMKWNEIVDGVYTTGTKTGDKSFRLTSHTMMIINSIEKTSIYVFTSIVNPQEHLKTIGKTWATVCKLSNIENLNLYDLRKTYSSSGTKKFGIHTSTKLTGHSSMSVVEKHYSHLDQEEHGQAKQDLADDFHNLLNGGGKVVKLGK